jgi:integrase
MVYLGEIAFRLVKESIEFGGITFLLPSHSRNPLKNQIEQPLLASSVAKALKRKLPELGFQADPFTPHDLRRTALTHMARLGVESTVLSHVANHVSETAKTITQRVYVRYNYEESKKRAWENWDAELTRMLASVDNQVSANPVYMDQEQQQWCERAT